MFILFYCGLESFPRHGSTSATDPLGFPSHLSSIVGFYLLVFTLPLKSSISCVFLC